MDSDDEDIKPLKRRRKKNNLQLVKGPKTPEKSKAQTLLPCSPLVLPLVGKAKCTSKQQTDETTKPDSAKLSSLHEGRRSSSQDRQQQISSSQERISSSQEKKELFASRNNKAMSKFFSVQNTVLPVRKFGLCPVCNIDLNFIHGISPQMHINHCLDTEPEFEKGYCSGDSMCSLSNERHFREYKHNLKLSNQCGESSETESDSERLLVEKALLVGDTRDLQRSDVKQIDLKNLKEEDLSEISSIEQSSSSYGFTKPLHDNEQSKPKKLTQTNIGSFFGGNKSKSNMTATVKLDSKSPSTSKPHTTSKQRSNGKTGSNKSKRVQVKKECPFYKKMPGTGITVDAFRYGVIPECTAYFLTHFHSDHYGGLTKKFIGKLYCSQITANLVKSQIGVDDSCIITLPMNEKVVVDDVEVVLLDANHCPGSVMFLMQLKNGHRLLHVGDFRADVSMFDNQYIRPLSIDTLYLDTTYCNPQYTFPPQEQVVAYVIDIARSFLQENPKTLIACGTYTVGKERVFKSLALSLGLKIGVSSQKMKVLGCITDNELKQVLTLDYNQAQLHVLPLGAFNQKKLSDHLRKYKPKYERVLAFKPTGWTYKSSSLSDIKPYTSADVITYGVPYSEHSSFSELQYFVKTLKPKKIIPTVNIGSKESRDKMNDHFKTWLA